MKVAGVRDALLDALRDRLTREPLAYAGVYGSRVGGWADAESDLDLVIEYAPADIDWAVAETLKDDLRAIAARDGLELDFAIGTGIFDDLTPAATAFFLTGPSLSGSAIAAAHPDALALALSAQGRAQLAALAAAKVMPWSALDRGDLERTAVAYGPSSLRPILETLAATAGYLRRDGKDRRAGDELVEALLADLAAGDAGLLRSLHHDALLPADAPAAAAALHRCATEVARSIERRLPR